MFKFEEIASKDLVSKSTAENALEARKPVWVKKHPGYISSAVAARRGRGGKVLGYYIEIILSQRNPKKIYPELVFHGGCVPVVYTIRKPVEMHAPLIVMRKPPEVRLPFAGYAWTLAQRTQLPYIAPYVGMIGRSALRNPAPRVFALAAVSLVATVAARRVARTGITPGN